MHEMSLCESILDILKEQAVQEKFVRVRRVCLEVGPFSSVEPEALRFGFDVVMRGSLADGAELEIRVPEATAFCPACREVVAISDRFDPCPKCGAVGLEIRSGPELRISELEVM